MPVTIGDMTTTRVPGTFALVYLVANSHEHRSMTRGICGCDSITSNCPHRVDECHQAAQFKLLFVAGAVAAEIGEPIVTVLVLLHQAGTRQVTYAVVEDAGREAFATREQRASTDRATAKLPEDTERPPAAQKIERSHDRSAGDRAPNW